MNNYSLVVMSCDKYSKFWIPFVTLFEKYWMDQDSIAQKIIVSERLKIKSINEFKILSPGSLSWTSRLKFALEKVQTEYVMVLLEDYLFSREIDLEFINFCKSFIEEYNPNKLLIHKNRPNHYKLELFDEPFFKFCDDSDYLTSVQLGFWKASWLKNILVDGMNPWEFEIDGTDRIKGLNNQVYFLNTEIDLHENVLRRGVVHPIWNEISSNENIYL